MPIPVKKFFTGLMLGGLLFGAPAYAFAMEAPDGMELAALANIYDPVVFDHEMHADMASCAACHHHTTGMPAEDEQCLRCHATGTEMDEVACTACHARNPAANEVKMQEGQAANLYHSDATGLKRAYHLRCLGCHREMEAVSGCRDCHAKREINLDITRADRE